MPLYARAQRSIWAWFAVHGSVGGSAWQDGPLASTSTRSKCSRSKRRDGTLVAESAEPVSLPTADEPFCLAERKLLPMSPLMDLPAWLRLVLKVLASPDRGDPDGSVDVGELGGC